MDIEIQTREDKIVFRVHGDITGRDAVVFCKKMEGARSSQCNEILLDLTGAGMIESTVIGAVAYSSLVLKKARKVLVVLAARRIKELFAACNLDQSIRIICAEEIAAPEEIFSKQGVVG